jgi:HAD superfamily hydrolase (TIGR01549 family)
VEAFVFDLDDTLIVEEEFAHTAVRQALVEVANASGDDLVESALTAFRRHWYSSPFYPTCRRLGMASWEGLWASFEGGHQSLEGIADWIPSYRHRAWADALGAIDADPALAPDVGRRYIELQRRGHPVIPQAIEAVAFVADKPTALLTNGPPDIQRLKIAQAGLATLVGVVVVSGEVGLGKPDPAVFELTLRLIGAQASEAIMVGDNWERDVQGALSAGMKAVWVSHGRTPPVQDSRVTVVDELEPGVLEPL